MMDYVTKLDERVEDGIDEWRSSVLTKFFEGLTSFGSPVVTLTLILFLFSFERSVVGVSLLLGLVLSGVLVTVIKRFVGRVRPESHLDVVFSEESFPSGHSTNAFGSAMILSQYFGRRNLFFGLAGLVAVSRVYLDDHYLSDVVAGSLLGVAIGLVVVFADVAAVV